MSQLTYLKVKIKSLAAEAKIIRHEERRMRSTASRWSAARLELLFWPTDT